VGDSAPWYVRHAAAHLDRVATALEMDVGTFGVSVSKDYLVFSSAHFITFRGHTCESLHGHNYRIGVTVQGPIDDECLFVVDFAILKRIVRRYVDIMDHRVLLPTKNPKLAFRTDGAMTFVEYFGVQSYQFPTKDCAMLPIANTTAEMIAEWVAHGVRDELAQEGAKLTFLEIEVEESFGQSATYSEHLEGA
jgi:6-pyruvoyltetrahydropterin/6-carboxytetrahydropterin synthase